ncbi:ABC transporter substrate-binding protein [Paucidesulfovibrio gracilis]|nr:ABC transporter substrate-binding protein [Paucidesulfovibrio gracilis]
MMLIVLGIVGCRGQGESQGNVSIPPGVTDKEIVLGSSLALTGHAGYLGTQTLRGAEAYLRQVNEEGGVHGRRIRILARDDAYDPPRCLANTQQFIINREVFGLFCYVGTPTTLKALPMVDEARIPLLGVFTGANALREPFNRYVINIRASYYEETLAAVHHLVEDLGFTRIAVFYQYDAYGFDGLVGAELALQDFGLEPVARGSYIRGTQNVEEGLARIRDSEAEAVVMVGTYGACARFIRRAGELGFDPVFYNVSFVGAEALARRLGTNHAQKVIMSQVVPPVPRGRQPLQSSGVDVEYVRALQRFFPGEPASFAGLEGYLNARILVEGLRRAGPHLTREGFLDAIESIRGMRLSPDLVFTFGPRDHQGMDQVYFTRLVEGRFELFEDWEVLHP